MYLKYMSNDDSLETCTAFKLMHTRFIVYLSFYYIIFSTMFSIVYQDDPPY